MRGGKDYSIEQQMLVLIEHNTKSNIWAKTKDGQTGNNPPKINHPSYIIDKIKEKESAEMEKIEKAMTGDSSSIRREIYGSLLDKKGD